MHPARRPALRENLPITATGPLPQIAIVGPKLDKNKAWLDYTLAHAGEKMGKHPVDVMLDMAVEENLETEFFAAPPNGIFVVFPQRKHMPLRVRLWIEFLKRHYAEPAFWRRSGAPMPVSPA